MEARALKDWLIRRLSGPEAEREWTEVLTAAGDALLAAPFDEVFPRSEVERLAVEVASDASLADWLRPGTRLALPLLLAHARADDAPLGRFVPEDARRRLEALAARPGWIDPDWVDAVFRQRAAEEMLADTLLASLRDFSTLVPRIVQSVLPSGLGRLAKLGERATGGVGGRVKEEVERRLEAEIKRFLEKGTRRGLERAAVYAVEHADEPAAQEARRELVRFALGRPGAAWVKQVDDEVVAELDAVIEAVARHAAGLPETVDLVRRAVGDLYDRLGGRSVRDALAEAGVTSPPPYERWAAATWPVLQTALVAPGVDRWMEGICAELLVEIRAEEAG